MAVEEAALPPEVEIEIVATDADRRALAIATEAVYRDDQMRPVSAERRRRHFVRGVGPRRGLWRVIAPLRDRVELCELDLDGPWRRGAQAGASFDVVFCHAPVARRVPCDAEPLIRRLAEVLAPGGALFLSQPTGTDGLPGFVRCAPGVYRRCT
jgi:chemotaxis protein methyltransferase CheR